MKQLVIAGAALLLATLGACVEGGETRGDLSEGGQIALSVGALNLPGVTEASYRLRVENGLDDLVFEVDLSSTQFGDGAGAVSYVGPCDAQTNNNTVSLTVLGLFTGAGGATPLDFVNPGTLTREVECLANSDVQVDFNVAVARSAEQGFFDIAVAFDDIFCSAKLDCETPEGDTLQLLHANGERAPTAVFGFSCAGGAEATANTTLYLDNLTIDCGGGNLTVVDTGAGPGNLNLATDVSQVGSRAPVLAAAVYRGEEDLTNVDKRFWNVAIAYDDTLLAPAGDNCTVALAGSASDGPFDNRTTPADTSWPVVQWDATLVLGNNTRACTSYGLDGGDEVATAYTSGAKMFDHAEPPIVIEATGPPPPAGPETLPGQILWLRSDTGVVESGGTITTWEDQSGNGNDFTQASPSRQPVLTASQNNGLPAVTVSSGASGSYLENNTAAMNLRTVPHTIVYVARLTGAGGRMLSGIDNNWLFGFWGGQQDTWFQEAWIGVVGGPGAIQNAWMVYTVTNDQVTSATYRDNRLMYTTTTELNGPIGLALNGYHFAGNDNEHSDGQFLEVIAYDRAITQAERDTLQTYFEDRYTVDDPIIMPSTIGDRRYHWRSDLGVLPAGAVDGQRVQGWDNLVTAFDDFTTSGTSSERPIFNTNQINGHPAITMQAATPTWMSASLSHGGVVTVFNVSRMTGGTSQRCLQGVFNNWLMGYHGGRRNRMYAEGWISQSLDLAGTDWHSFSFVTTGSGGAGSFWADGAFVASSAAGTAGPSGFTINNNSTVGEASDCQVAEIMLYNRALTNWERSEIERYLNNRYALY